MKYFYYVEKRQLNWRFLAWALVALVISALIFSRGIGKLDHALSGVFFAAGALLLYLSNHFALIKKLPVKREEIGEGSQ